MMQLMVVLSLIINVVVLLPVCAGLLTDASTPNHSLHLQQGPPTAQ